jgi:acetylornithine deacetylase
MDTKAILSDLVGFPSVCGMPNGPIVDYVRAYLAGHQVSSHVIGGPEGDRFNLFASIGPTDRPGYVLSGHMDVVSTEGQTWNRDPFTLTDDNGCNFGRGSVDMKGFLACVLAMVPEFSAMPLKRPIHIAFSYDEELGCRGVKHLLDNMAPLCVRPAACIVGEPSDMQPVLSHKGKVAMEFTLNGRSGHSSNPTLGENAIYPAADLIGFIRDLASRVSAEGPFDARFEPPYSTLQVGTVRGGTAVNIIPGTCALEMEVRTIPAQSAKDIVAPIIAELKRIEHAARLAGGALEASLAETSSYPALAPNPDTALAKLMVELTGRPARQSVSYGTEAGLYQQAGIPAIICGPGSITRAHKPNEFIHDSELDQCLAMLRGLGAFLSKE